MTQPEEPKSRFSFITRSAREVAMRGTNYTIGFICATLVLAALAIAPFYGERVIMTALYLIGSFLFGILSVILRVFEMKYGDTSSDAPQA